MEPAVSSVQVFRFGQFEADTNRHTLTRNGVRVKIQDQPLRVLIFLLKRPGEIVTREELRQVLWPEGTFVDFEGSLNVILKRLRAALDDDSDNPRFIETVPRRGYRFIAPVTEIPTNNSSPAELIGDPATGRNGEAVRTHGSSWPRRFLILPAIAVVLVLAGAIFLLRPYVRSGPNAQKRVMLAILPFQNLSDDPQQEYFSDGLTEETITDLGQLNPERLGVIARTSAMAYKHSEKTIGQIGRELGVDYVLEGSVRRQGDKVRISAQLIRVGDQTHLWARNYDRELKDLIEVQNDIGEAIAAQVQANLTPRHQTEFSRTHTLNPQAHDAYLLGLQGWNQRSREGFRQAITNFTRATELDPNYALAFAGLARVYALAPIFAGMPTSEAAPKALAAAEHALTLDETLADAHSALGFVKAHYEYDWPSAEREFRRAIQLDPNDAYAHFFFSNSYLSPFAKHQEAIAEMKEATELDPLSTRMQSFAGKTLIWARQYNAALAQYKKVEEIEPNFALNHERLAQLDALLEKYEEAISEETKARMLAGENPERVLSEMGKLRRAETDRGADGYWETELELSREEPNPPEFYSRPYGVAVIYTHLRDKDKAFANLEAAYSQRDTQMTEIGVEPQFDSLRSDSRFTDLKGRVKLPRE